MLNMANTYTQIYIQIVFAVQGRSNLIRKDHKEELHKYITGIIRNRGQKLLAINSMPDHTHILTGMKPTIALSDLVRDIKSSSSRYINEKRWVRAESQLAGRVWGLFVWSFTVEPGHKIYSGSRKASRKEVVPGRIF